MTQPISSLLDLALDGHGGLHRWTHLETVSATMTVGGPLFALKGHPTGLGTVQAIAETRSPRITFTPFANATRGVFEPGRVIVSRDGDTDERRDDPRSGFTGIDRDDPWDDLHLLYFAGYAIWNYLCAPFFFTWPGFTLEEIEPWTQDAETWRRLLVTFPPDVPTHNPQQVFYFDDRGLLRRLDYMPEILGPAAAPAAHYCDSHQDFDGLIVPTRRRVYIRRDDGIPATGFAVVEIDISDVTIA
jgi:hypothetical protein